MKKQAGSTWLDKTLFVTLAMIILGTIGTLSYFIAVPKVGETFTEFYILNNDNEAKNYPQELVVGEEAKVVVGIVNREQKTVSYHLEVRINQVRNNEWGPLVLEDTEKWEEAISFRPDTVGDNQKVEFLLYKSGQNEAYSSLHLWISVKN